MGDPALNSQLRKIRVYRDKLDVFYGGIADDPRIQKPEVFQISSHFDIWTFPKKLVPYRAMEAVQDQTFSIVMFLYANSTVYGLGVVVGTGKAKNYQLSDPLIGSWGASTSGEDGGGTRFQKCFINFHNYNYGGAAGTRIWAYGDITGSPTFTATAYSGAGEPVCQGIVTTDDLLIIPCGSGIAKKNGAGSGPTDTWSVFNLIPSGYTPTDICESGDFVIITAKPTSGVGNSKGFIWDKVSTDLTDIIDWGEGDAVITDAIEGSIISISNVGGSSSFGIKPKVVIREYEGGNKSRVIFELEGDSGSTLSIYGNHCKFRDSNRLVFGMSIKLDGVTYRQFFAVGRKTQNYPVSVTPDRLVNNDTALSNAIQGAMKLGNYVFVAYNNDGSVNRTNDQSVFSNATGTFITQKLTGERQAGEDARRKRKTLNMAGVLCETLTSGQSISLYYRVNATSAYTLIRTYSFGDDSIGMGFEAGVESDGSDFKNFQELQFKALGVNGAIPTAFIYSFNVDDGDVQS